MSAENPAFSLPDRKWVLKTTGGSDNRVSRRDCEKTLQSVKTIPSSSKKESPRISPESQSVVDYYARLDDVKENTSDPITTKTLDSPILRPVSEKSPILPARQKMSPEKTTGYGRGRLRRETAKPETGRVGPSSPAFGPKNINGPSLPRLSLAL